jgi:hypothetical protein
MKSENQINLFFDNPLLNFLPKEKQICWGGWVGFLVKLDKEERLVS